ncbi:MAG: ImmA/IrrE family metallo-endopeptidase [Alphaproteobacteria bacterium]|nr:ImmA/IrrE family metallo-endopeptidase [Alphaproteobacteria bacterium]
MRAGRTAQQLLEDLCISAPEDIDMEVIAFHCGVEVQYAPLKGCAAHIIGAGDRAVITVDAAAGEGRKRFSIGHEIGHWMRDRGKALSCGRDDLSGPWTRLGREPLANGFAADLLMPPALFAPRAHRRPGTFAAIEELAEEFKVSRAAAAKRFVELGSSDTMLLHFDADGRRRWFQGSRRVDGNLWPVKVLSPDTDAWDIVRGGAGNGRSVTVEASDWFDHRSARDYEVKEHSVPYMGGVLTLLWWQKSDMIEDLVP